MHDVLKSSLLLAATGLAVIASGIFFYAQGFMRSQFCLILSMAVTPAVGFQATAWIIARILPSCWNRWARWSVALAVSAVITFLEMWAYMYYVLNTYGA
jgi:hypothetical protein